MNRFLLPDIPPAGSPAELSSEESHHLAKVLRAQAGRRIVLIDGKGTLAEAEVLEASPKRTRVKVLEVSGGGEPSRVHLAFAVPKGQAFDFIVHRATEVGVASFQPLVTEHSLSAKNWNEERWRKVVAEVGKQCQELHFPLVSSPLPLVDWLEKRAPRPLVFCDESDREASMPDLSAVEGVDILVGAEGGWSPAESRLIREKGALLLGLGKNRLRTETACLVSLVLVKQGLRELR